VQPPVDIPRAASVSALAQLELHTLLVETAMLVTEARERPPDREVLMARKLTRRAARQMAAARKSFRGGRPVTPKLCPRCGTPCASAVQAAAHCVGPAVRERKEAARLAAARPARSAESVKRVYPSWRYHRTKPAVMVKDPNEEADLGEGWADRPAAFKG